MRVARRLAHAAALLVVFLAVGAAGCGRHEGPGEIAGERLPEAVLAERTERQQASAAALAEAAAVAPADEPTQILFGDLHVHTTFSIDAFGLSLPMMQGEGAHPPADACDFARYCSALDFWSINDHAEGLTPQHWQETRESLRQCNAGAGDPANPDIVAFLGWEWSQVGSRPEEHFGHKNVIFRDLADEQTPARPIASPPRLLAPFLEWQREPWWVQVSIPLHDLRNARRYLDFGRFQRELRAVPACDAGIDTRELPSDCHEIAETPAELFEKLSQWGFDTIVIPHGTTWGMYTPPLSTFAKQLVGRQHDASKQRLFEVYSGHGNSEEYRGWLPSALEAVTTQGCPAPTREYLPCCWRAGEIIRSRCEDPASEQCERRVAEARANYVAAGLSGHLTVAGADVADWLDCGQCRDCFNPSFNYRPRGSVQYALALGNFDRGGEPRRFRFGFIGSSDNHKARPGTGYKEYDRLQMTESAGPPTERWHRRLAGEPAAAEARSRPLEEAARGLRVVHLWEGERQASYFMTGGLVAVHARGRSRDAIWNALESRAVYATSGGRTLLWFDLVNGPDGARAMGSEVELAGTPRFRVRAAGAFEQLPGCPEHATSALSPERLAKLCRGECYNPSDRRRPLSRIEVVRIRPQSRPDELVGDLIEDPWRTFSCPPDPAGCVVEFSDEEFAAAGRETVYYVRAIERPSPAVNAGGVRCRYDDSGNCVEARPCYGDWRTSPEDDCLSLNEERAWSSPIYLLPAP